MDTTEKTREEARQRPAPKRPAGARKPAPQGRSRAAAPVRTEEQAAPRKRPESRKRPAQAAAPAAAQKAAPKAAQKAAAPRRPQTKRDIAKLRKTAAPPTGSGYRPYQKEKSRQRAVKNQNFARKFVKFFSYENPIVQFFSHTDSEVFGGSSARSKRQAEREARRRKRAQELGTPAIIYTQPKVFNRNRLVVQMLTILGVVLAIVLGMSVFFKVKYITVSGADVYSPWTVREVSGINEGDNLLTFGRTRASGQIIANLPYVKSARIGIKLPDTVNIEIVEDPVVYSIQDNTSVWWLMDSDGKVIEQTSSTQAKKYTQVLGVTLNMPHPGEQALATEKVEETTEEGETLPEGEEEPYEPVLRTASVQLNAALGILKALEANDIVGEATSVDVSRLEDVILWYGTQYQVNLGNTSNMEYKIACMNDVIAQMSDYQTGILDITFTTWEDQVGYTPFG